MTKDLFTEGPVNNVWAMWWVEVFQIQKVLDALLYLLLTVLKTDIFMNDSAQFGIDWITNCVLQPKVIRTSAQLCTETFVHQPEVVSSALDYISWFVQQDRVQDLACGLAQKAILSE